MTENPLRRSHERLYSASAPRPELSVYKFTS